MTDAHEKAEIIREPFVIEDWRKHDWDEFGDSGYCHWNFVPNKDHITGRKTPEIDPRLRGFTPPEHEQYQYSELGDRPYTGQKHNQGGPGMRPSTGGMRPSSSQQMTGRPRSQGGIPTSRSMSRSMQVRAAGAESRTPSLFIAFLLLVFTRRYFAFAGNYGHSWERSNAKFSHVPTHSDKFVPPVQPPQESSYARTVAETLRPGALSLKAPLAKGAPIASSRPGSRGMMSGMMMRPMSIASQRPASQASQRPASRAQQRAAASARSDIQSVRDLR
jgi:hypothetical protein